MPLLNREDAETVVSRLLGSDVQFVEYQLEPFAKSNNGIYGEYQLLSVDVEEVTAGVETKMKTYTFFVKSPTKSSIINEYLLDKETVVEEINFYKNVYPVLAKNIIGNRWSAQCYLIKDEVLVFEDLRSQGYCVREDIPLDETEFLKSSLATLAQFHAASIATEAKLGKTLREAFPTAFVEKLYSKSTKYSKCIRTGYKTIFLMAEKFGTDASLTQKIYDQVYEWVRYREGKCNVVCHGDLWKNNLLINKNASPNCILVDFQLLRYASPACDIGMLLFLHTTPAFRKKFEFELFDHYYSVLRDTLERSKSKPTVPNYEDLREDYRQLRIIGMAYASLYLPAILLKSDTFELLMNDPSEMNKWYLYNRIDLIASNMEVDLVYKMRLKGVIEELFEEGRRIFET